MRRSSACCFLTTRCAPVRIRPCRPRSFTWITRMASSSGSGGRVTVASCFSCGGFSPCFSISVSRNFSRSTSSCARSDTKYRGMGTSTIAGWSLRSTRMSSKCTPSVPPLSPTSHVRTSSIRPMQASTAFLISCRFCGWTIWS